MDINLETIIRSVPEKLIPAEVKKATAFNDAAHAELETATTAPPVDLNSAVTPDDIPKVIKAALDRDRDSDRHIELARELKKLAGARLESAWMQGAQDLEPYFGKEFNAYAAKLYEAIATAPKDPELVLTEHWTPEGARLQEIVSTLDILSHVRHAYANMANVRQMQLPISREHEKSSRTAIFDNAATEQTFRTRVLQRQANYWLTLAQFPGAKIAWQTLAQQMEQPEAARVLAAQAAMKAAV